MGLLLPKPRPRRLEKAAQQRAIQKLHTAVYAAVTARDGGRCRHCGGTFSVERHHLVYRSQGGATSSQNVVLLCNADHRRVHARILLVHGSDADGELRFEMVDR